MNDPEINLSNSILIAPCGIDCRFCRAFERDKNPCPGCRVEDVHKPKTRLACPIKTCEKRIRGGFEYCFACDEFPCSRLSHLDKRYRDHYGLSVLENLSSIQDSGVEAFIAAEDKKWTCPQCGSKLCIHKPDCLACGYVWRNP